MKQLLSIEAMTAADIEAVLDLAATMKSKRGHLDAHPLRHQCWALIFTKSSTRTRVSFEVGVRELGGDVLFLNANDIQLGRGEPIKDTARVLGRMLHGAIIRTFAQSDVEEFAKYSGLPTINALTDGEHPCQILADLQTIREKLGTVEGRVVTFVGDGACNVPISWMWAAARFNFQVRIAAPKAFQPDAALLARLNTKNVTVTDDLNAAAEGADVLYTDVWASMGQEGEQKKRERDFAGYTVDRAMMARAAKDAIFLHCLPAHRGEEVTADVIDGPQSRVWDEAENRLHIQKAIMAVLMGGEPLG